MFIFTLIFTHQTPICWNSLPNNTSSPMSQPTLRREDDAWLAGACSKKGVRAESPPTFIWGKRRKNWKRRDLQTLSERFGSCIYAQGRYQHPTRPSQETATFNQMCKYDFNFYVPFYVFIYFCTFYIFLSFCGRRGCFPCSYVFLNCDKEIRPT